MFRFGPRRLGWLTAILLAFAVGGGVARGQEADEYYVKAALLAKIPAFIEWPKNAMPGDDKTFYIGIVGPSPFGDHLKTLEMQQVKNKQIVVRRFATIKEYLPCHLLFISNVKEKDEGAAQRLTNSLEKTKDQPLLLITDSEGLAEKGAVINFYLEGSNVKIEMNRDAEKRAGLTTSAQFLSIIERNGRFVKRAKEGN